MGNRACILFFDAACVSPTVYLHWHGDSVPGWLDQLSSLMKGRYGDASYAAARFVGLCHEHIDGNLSLGVSSNSFSVTHVQSSERMENASPGNAGMVVVNTSDFSWRAYGGYLAEFPISNTSTHQNEVPDAE